MTKIGLLARIEAKPEYAEKVENMLREAVNLANEEEQTITWFAFRENETTFGVFDTFEDESGRRAHLRGRIAVALMDATSTMLIGPPDIREIDVLAAKLS